MLLLNRWSYYLGLFLSALCATTTAGDISLNEERPNIIMVLADDLGWADVGFHGSSIPTPNIDSIARDGVRLERFYVNPVCSVTRSALMTGLCTVRTGVNNHTPLPLNYRLLPAVLRDAGYQTWMCGKWHLGGKEDPAQLPQARGFDHFYGHLHGAIDYFEHFNKETGEPDWQRNGVEIKEAGYSTDLLVDESIHLVQTRDKQKPFFLYLAYNAVHGPLGATEELLAKFAKEPDKKKRSLMAALSGLDQATGRLLKMIDSEGLRQNTMLFFCSDNGGQLSMGSSNLPLRGEKSEPWEGGVRSASAIRWPGKIAVNSISKQLMWIGDLLPTFASIAKAKATGIPQGLDGINVWSSLASGTTVERPLFYVGSGGMSVFDNEWKLVVEERQASPALFKIVTDPNETTDLAAQNPDRVKTMLAALKAVESTAPPKAPGGEKGEGGKKKGEGKGGGKNKKPGEKQQAPPSGEQLPQAENH